MCQYAPSSTNTLIIREILRILAVVDRVFDRRLSCCAAPNKCCCAPERTNSPPGSGQELGDIDQLLRNFKQREVAAHRELAHQPIGVVFADLLLLHYDALGFFDNLALGESALGGFELVAQRAIG